MENHEGKETTVEELLDQYYKDPDKYFEVNDKSNAAPPSTNDGGAATGTTSIAISRTSIE